jgi:hypothetical protein
MYVKELSSGSVNGSHNMMGICDVPLANFVDNDKLGGTHTLLRGYTMPFLQVWYDTGMCQLNDDVQEE